MIVCLEKLCDLKLFLESWSVSLNFFYEMNIIIVGYEFNLILFYEFCCDFV